MKMNDQTALVTGANRGIGKALVEELLARGVRRVYAAARDPRGVEALVARHGGRVVALGLDVTAPEQIEAAARQVSDVTVLFNNAGRLGGFSLISTPLAEIEQDFATNFYGSLAVTRALLPALERAPGGAAIVNVLTVVSLASMPGLGGYSASKAAALSMTQALRAELKSRRIDVHSIFPGPVDTDMARDIQLPKTGPDAVARAILDGIERGDEDIYPDPMSQQVVAAWKASPKEIERQFASM
jgi:NAD(P)-dependent dehydrogenase (short-subunit alcohol dehydrogenase family)